MFSYDKWDTQRYFDSKCPPKMLRTIILIIAFIAVQGFANNLNSLEETQSDPIKTSDECVQLSVGAGRILCVCNATYCDGIDDPPKPKPQEVQWYTSTKDGLRLHHSTSKLSTNEWNNLSEPIIETIFTINSKKKYQQIYGFGGALTDAAALNIRILSNETQQKLLQSYFGPRGIGYTHCRIPIAGTDFSTRPYTYDDTPDDVTLSNFSLVEEDNHKIRYLHNIMSIMKNSDDLRIFTTSWSAPAWMKTTDNIKWGALKGEYYQIYADYIRKFFDAYKERGIDIWGMTPGNEPLDGFIPFFSFNAMAWTPQKEAYWTKYYLKPTLLKAGYNPVYMAMDDQRFELPWFVDDMFENNDVFEGIAVHWYTDALFSPDRLTDSHDRYPDKFILLTEACMGSESPIKVDLASWERGEKYIIDILENICHWVVGWVDWNIALDEHGGPNWAKNFVDSPIIVNKTTDEFYKQPMYYALAHFSKFVPRNSYRIFSTGLKINQLNEPIELTENLLKIIAFLTPHEVIAMIIVNMSNEDQHVTIQHEDVPDFKITKRVLKKSFNTVRVNMP